MVCPKCKIEARISNSKYVTEGDASPNEETKLYIVQEFTCRNPQCTGYGKVVAAKKNSLKLEKDEEQS